MWQLGPGADFECISSSHISAWSAARWASCKRFRRSNSCPCKFSFLACTSRSCWEIIKSCVLARERAAWSLSCALWTVGSNACDNEFNKSVVAAPHVVRQGTGASLWDEWTNATRHSTLLSINEASVLPPSASSKLLSPRSRVSAHSLMSPSIWWACLTSRGQTSVPVGFGVFTSCRYWRDQ